MSRSLHLVFSAFKTNTWRLPLDKRKLEKLISSMPEESTQVSMILSGCPDMLALIRRIIAASVDNLSVKPALLNDIKLATTEACTNVIKHAYQFDTKRTFDLKIKVSNELILIEVSYDDPDFIPEKIPVPNLDEIKEGGLGVFIIRNIMDAAQYNTNKETGRVVLKMIKLFNP